MKFEFVVIERVNEEGQDVWNWQGSSESVEKMWVLKEELEKKFPECQFEVVVDEVSEENVIENQFPGLIGN